MVTKTPSKVDTKAALMRVGMDLMLEKGYSNTGIQEILNALGVPKGSFYHYFDSKESFALEVINHYEQELRANLERVLLNKELAPIARLSQLFTEHREKLASQQCRRGCLIGNLSQEMADQSEVLRTALAETMGRQKALFTATIEEGQMDGSITKSVSASDLAEFLLSAQGGAVMRAKTLKCTEPLDTFKDVAIEGLLRA